nr:MAG TPA: hypothetical protein [Caudoviricetes sp.]
MILNIKYLDSGPAGAPSFFSYNFFIFSYIFYFSKPVAVFLIFC